MNTEQARKGGGWADLSHGGGSMLAYNLVRELEAGEDLGEDLGLHHYFGHVHAVLGNLGQCTAHLPLQLGLLLQNQGSQIRHGTCNNPRLAAPTTSSCAKSELMWSAEHVTLQSPVTWGEVF